jgi:Bacteriocin-protection, YdeI or OmpD-Associated
VAALSAGKRPAVVVNVNGYEYRSTIAPNSSPTAAAAWDKLSYTRKKEHARSVLDAKKAETRTRRIAAVLAKLDG